MRRFTLLVLTVFAVFVTGCQAMQDLFGPASPPPPAFSSQVAPLPIYTQWWKQVEQCSGRTRDMAELSWYDVGRGFKQNGTPLDGAVFYEYQGLLVSGDYLPHYAIVFADAFSGTDSASAMLIRHEMLHALRRDTGTGHDALDFTVKCKGVVMAPDGSIG